jgi:hypothetical protein
LYGLKQQSQIDLISEEHDKRIAENYVFDEVLGRHVSRTEYEKKAKFNQDDYKPTPDEISRFPSRPKQEQAEHNQSENLTPSVPLEQMGKDSYPKFRPL